MPCETRFGVSHSGHFGVKEKKNVHPGQELNVHLNVHTRSAQHGQLPQTYGVLLTGATNTNS